MNTRNLTTILCLFLTTNLIFSCSEDDNLKDNIPEITNSFLYDGNEYSITEGLIEDLGYASPGVESNSSDTHGFYIFNFTDGTYQLEEHELGDTYSNKNSTYTLYVGLFCPDTTTFRDGEYSYVNISEVTSDQVINKKVFGQFAFWIDLNGNGIYDAEDEETYTHSAGGTVNVSGSDNNYIIWFDIVMRNGKTLTGSAQKSFKYSNN